MVRRGLADRPSSSLDAYQPLRLGPNENGAPTLCDGLIDEYEDAGGGGERAGRGHGKRPAHVSERRLDPPQALLDLLSQLLDAADFAAARFAISSSTPAALNALKTSPAMMVIPPLSR